MKSSNRLLRIVKYLETKKEVYMKDICFDLNISERVCRYEISNLNDFLDLLDIKKINKISKGKFSVNFSSEDNIFERILNIQKASLEDRQRAIKFLILINAKLNLTKLTKYFSVSRNTIKNDVNEVEKVLNDYNILVKNNSIISADEEDIRRLILQNYIPEYLEWFNDIKTLKFDLSKNLILENINIENKEKIKILIEKIRLNFYKQKISDYFIAYILLVFQRIQSNNIIKNKNKFFSNNSYEYISIKNIFKENQFINISDVEISGLADLMIGLNTSSLNVYNFDNIVETNKFVEDLISSVSEETNINFYVDELLHEGLVYHLKSIETRNESGMIYENEEFYKTAIQYNKIFNAVIKSLKSFEKVINSKISKNEEALIAVHFICSLQRIQENDKLIKKVLVVCNSGYVTSSLIVNLIEKNYNIKVIDTIAISSMEKVKDMKFDIIISTVKISYEISSLINKPIVYIGELISFSDNSVLSKYNITKRIIRNNVSLDKVVKVVMNNAEIKEKSKLYEELSQLLNIDNKNNLSQFNLIDIVEEKDIFIFESGSWMDFLSLCNESLIYENKVTPNYLNEIVESVEKYGTYFSLRNNIVVPHGSVSNDVIGDGIKIVYIKSGTKFNDGTIAKLIFYICSKDKIKMINTITKIGSLSNLDNVYDNLSNSRTKKEFKDTLTSLLIKE